MDSGGWTAPRDEGPALMDDSSERIATAVRAMAQTTSAPSPQWTAPSPAIFPVYLPPEGGR